MHVSGALFLAALWSFGFTYWTLAIVFLFGTSPFGLYQSALFCIDMFTQVDFFLRIFFCCFFSYDTSSLISSAQSSISRYEYFHIDAHATTLSSVCLFHVIHHLPFLVYSSIHCQAFRRTRPVFQPLSIHFSNLPIYSQSHSSTS